MSWRAGHAYWGGALGHWGNVPVAVCRMSVGNGRDPVNRCTLNIDTWDYSHAPLQRHQETLFSESSLPERKVYLG